ncbi:hypothetical protein GOBAR_AA11311 [Gossypium barbadense]|uniref:Uncharacterized protein n=1 Tax=Gossypium barbadense TaxID=3634 RepID=A0A2P5Y169_GOSBA|nr:hypothetical protein GOBAR_AA11311 [Gossypium barbadense]
MNSSKQRKRGEAKCEAPRSKSNGTFQAERVASKSIKCLMMVWLNASPARWGLQLFDSAPIIPLCPRLPKVSKRCPMGPHPSHLPPDLTSATCFNSFYFYYTLPCLDLHLLNFWKLNINAD